MAIQNRRGSYADFGDGSNLVDGEFGMVQSGDTNTADGTGIYAAPVAGTVHRLLVDDDKTELAGDIAQNTQDISTLNSNLTQKFTSGTWTPSVARASVDSASGKWYRAGDLVLLTGFIHFSSSQTNQGNIYIPETSLPSVAAGRSIGGVGAAEYNYVISSTNTNSNMWVAQVGAGRITAPQIANTYFRFTLMAVTK